MPPLRCSAVCFVLMRVFSSFRSAFSNTCNETRKLPSLPPFSLSSLSTAIQSNLSLHPSHYSHVQGRRRQVPHRGADRRVQGGVQPIRQGRSDEATASTRCSPQHCSMQQLCIASTLCSLVSLCAVALAVAVVLQVMARSRRRSSER